MSDTPFAIAIELDGGGAHPSAGRDSTDLLSPRHLSTVVGRAERFGFTAATFEDSPLPPGGVGRAPDVRLDAVQRAAFAAGLTSSIGLVPVAHVAYSEPFHVATQLASLDWASAGRAGWIPAASGTAREGAAFGRPALTDDELERERTDVIAVARALWDSWENDAVIRDLPTGRYIDRDKVHYVDFVGERFTVKGPLITPRPPQGQLVVVGPSGVAGIDVALVDGADAGEIAAAATAARAAGAAHVWAELEVVVDAAGAPAQQRLDALDTHGIWGRGSRLRHVGDAASLAALLTALSAHVDGVRLHPAVVAVDLDEIGLAVLPSLRTTTGFRSPRAGDTLRASLGLPRPDNRFAGAGTRAAATVLEEIA